MHTVSQVRAADRRVFLPMWGFSESFNVSVASALVLQRLLDASEADRGKLPPGEMVMLRKKWYEQFARNPEQREKFARVADQGGVAPFQDTRRPEAFRHEQRRAVERRTAASRQALGEASEPRGTRA